MGFSPVEVVGMGTGADGGMDAGELRAQLGIMPGDFPVLLHGGEGKNARQDFGVWTAAIMAQLYPRTRLILRQDARTLSVPGLERFGEDLPDERVVIVAPWQMSWRALLGVSDVLLVTATGTIPVGSVVEAKAAGVPVVGTPVGCVKELVRHGETGLIAKHIGIGIAPPVGRKTIRPRAMAAAVERMLSTVGLAREVAERAKGEGVGEGVEGILRVYRGEEVRATGPQSHTEAAQSHTETD
jgi:hypothetical protein